MRLTSYAYVALRRFVHLPFLLLVAFMSLHSAAEAAPSSERLILAFGDSLTAGYGLKPNESFPAQLEALLRSDGRSVRVHNAGVSGDTTTGGRNRLNWVLAGLKQKPDLVILELGANDMLRGIDPSITRANLDAMMTEFKKRGIPVVLAGMFSAPNLGVAYIDSYNSIYPDLAKKHGATLYPFFLKGVAFNEPLLLADRIHPNRQGVAVIARNILPTVRKVLDGLPAPKTAPGVSVPAKAAGGASTVHRN